MSWGNISVLRIIQQHSDSVPLTQRAGLFSTKWVSNSTSQVQRHGICGRGTRKTIIAASREAGKLGHSGNTTHMRRCSVEESRKEICSKGKMSKKAA